ncbi:MAG: lipid-A-disaccharide synthase [Candidatus Omnitrophota bacterium]
MAQIRNILIVCGEPSGDLLAGSLASQIRALDPQIKINAVGGQALTQSKANVFYNIKDLAVMGLFDVLKNIPKFLKLKQIVLDKIREEKPDAVILVDFSGFNLRLAKDINNQAPVIYYVSPQIWASRPGRIRQIKKFIRRMIVLFKFEEELYRSAGVDTYFAGHPLVDIVKIKQNKEEFLKDNALDPQKTTIALLPGSRKQEIKHILPVMLKTAGLIAKKYPQAQFIIARSENVELVTYQRMVKASSLNIKIIEGRTHDCLNAADLSLVCSGTATLEAGLVGNPFLIVYKMSLLNYLLYRPQVKIPFIGIINIIAQKKIIPEFIQFKACAENISFEAVALLNDPKLQQKMQNDLKDACVNLGSSGASLRAAQSILPLLKK